jgi:hypothetical protein
MSVSAKRMLAATGVVSLTICGLGDTALAQTPVAPETPAPSPAPAQNPPTPPADTAPTAPGGNPATVLPETKVEAPKQEAKPKPRVVTRQAAPAGPVPAHCR